MVYLSDGRTRRVVKYRRGVEVWEYVSGMKRLPGPYSLYDDPGFPRHRLHHMTAQWTAWLSHTRHHHPTIQVCSGPLPCYIRMLNSTWQELTTDIARIELTRRNAAILEARAAEERAQLVALRAVGSPETSAQAVTEPAKERVDPAAVSNQALREKFAKEQRKGLREALWKPDTDEAEAWTPRAVRRRG